MLSSEKNLSINNWHTIEYTQLQIPNTTIAELTIKVNGTALHKIINIDAKEYQNINVYFGFDRNRINDESTIPDGKIRNFTIEKNNPGRSKNDIN